MGTGMMAISPGGMTYWDMNIPDDYIEPEPRVASDPDMDYHFEPPVVED